MVKNQHGKSFTNGQNIKMIETLKDILNFNIISTSSFNLTTKNIVLLAVVILMTSVVLRIFRSLITRKLPIDDKNKFISFFQFIRYIVFIFAIILTLDASGVNMKVFLTASAALLVGLGFALQQLFQDVISGILMVIDQSLHVGDIIEVDGRVGKVQEIKLRTTRVVTRNDRVMVIPNHKFMNEVLFNWTQNTTSNREQVSVGVAYGSDVNLVRDILIECANETDGIIHDQTIKVLFEDFGDSSLNFSVYFYVINGMASPKTQSDIRFKIDEKFRKNNISIPFPQRDVHVIGK